MYGLDNNTGPSGILVQTALDKLLAEEQLQEQRTGKVEATDEVVFTQDTATNNAVVSSVLGGGGYFDQTVDDVAPNKDAALKAAALKTTVMVHFKKNVRISRTFMADQQQGAVAKGVRLQYKTWLASQARNAVSVYALGFSTQNTIDGANVFSDSHTNQNGDNVDNKETGVLTDDNLNVVINSLRTQLDQAGVIVGYEPDFLLTPSVLHKQGMSVAKSVLRAGTGNNDLNYWSEMYPGMKVVYSPFLDATSTTAYYVGARGHGITRFERESFFTKLVDWETSENDTYIYKMRAREQVDSITYDGLVASNGTV